MNTFNFQYPQLLEMQKQALEPMRQSMELSSRYFARIVRQNHEVAGDWADLAIEHANLAAGATDVAELVGKQTEANRAFGEKLVRRVQEYTDIAKDGQSDFNTVVKDTAQAAV